MHYFDFSREQITDLTCPDEIGALETIFVESTTENGWKMRWIVIINMDTGVRYRATCDCWVDYNSNVYEPSVTLDGKKKSRFLS